MYNTQFIKEMNKLISHCLNILSISDKKKPHCAISANTDDGKEVSFDEKQTLGINQEKISTRVLYLRLVYQERGYYLGF